MIYLYRLSICIIFLQLFEGFVPVEAQTRLLKGEIVDEETGKAVEFGFVLNYSRHVNIYSSISGEFIMDADQGDTLVFSAVGYYYQKVIVNDSLLKASMPVRFILMPRAYEIKEARIVALGTYDEFRQKFINLDNPKTKTEVLAEKLADMSHKAAREAYDMAKANQKLDGITFFTVPILTPEEKERIALARIIKQEKIRDEIYQKFNPAVVKKVTGLKEDSDIIGFMVFCDFSDQYLLKVNQYDLMVQLALKFEAYKRKKHPANTGNYPVNMNRNIINPNA
jgi:hypothetical protein